MKTAVAFIVYSRPETTRRVFERIRKAKPPRIYLIADGPKVPGQSSVCEEVRNIVESGIDWNCEFHRIYSDKNLGCARRAQTGLDLVFEQEDQAIILEDDTLPDPSFFKFCEELLFRYKYNDSVFHIAGMNMFPQLFRGNNSYCFTSIPNMWGWATWSRAWKHYDLQMKDWNNENKKQFLSKWCVTRSLQKGMGSMFDLHCDNDDPWTWDYQWFYACWRNGGMAVLPAKNIVSNIGIGPSATHTVNEIAIPLFPSFLQFMNSPLTHPQKVERNLSIEKQYRKLEETTKLRRFKNFLKEEFPWIFNMVKCLLSNDGVRREK
jgi:hypothetical protein